jgi:hypothetical protein
MSANEVTDEDVLTDIRRVARLLQHSPSSVEYRRHGRFDVRTAQRKFGLPWGRIVQAAGLRYAPRTSHRIPATEELRRDVLRVAREVGHPPTRTEYRARGRFDSETVRRRSGAKRWEDAVALLTGADPEEVKRHQRRGGCYRTTQEWLARLRQLSRSLGQAPTTAEANSAGINAQELRRRVRGGWAGVLDAAGISLRTRSPRALALSATADSMIADVAAVARRLGRVPTLREYEEVGRYSYAAVRRRVGGWRRVKQILAGAAQGRAGREGERPAPEHAGAAAARSAAAAAKFFQSAGAATRPPAEDPWPCHPS